MNTTEAVAAVIEVLNRVGTPYMLVGSLSSNMYTQPRFTHDADFVVQFAPGQLTSIVSALGSDFRLDPQMSFETVTATLRYRIQYAPTGFMIELFELSADAHDQLRLSRRRQTVFAAVPVFVPTAEDVVITKLRWSRGGNRRKDVDDVANVLAVQQGRLDLAYIRHWCDQHGTRELFERLLAEASPV